MQLTGIKWDVFTAEERAHIEDIVARGEFANITQAISVDDPEKEYWVSRILDQVAPAPPILESKVQEDLLKAQSSGKEIDTPEKEAEWQKKFDEEKTEFETKIKKGRKAKMDKEAAELKAKEEEATRLAEDEEDLNRRQLEWEKQIREGNVNAEPPKRKSK